MLPGMPSPLFLGIPEYVVVMSAEENLKALNIVLPSPPAAVAAYEPWMRTGNLVFTSGQLPWRDGEMAFSGRCGEEINEEHGYRAARQCALNAIAQLRDAAGDLDRIRRIVRVEGYVHTAPGFRGHPQVLNGASDLFNAVLANEVPMRVSPWVSMKCR